MMNEQIFAILIAFAIIGSCFFVLGRTYWLWYRHQSQFPPGSDSANRKPTLFDVRELLLRGEKEKAIRIYRQIFKTDQKSAQAAIADLEKNLHNHGG